MCSIPGTGYEFPRPPVAVQLFPTQWMEAWQFGWIGSLDDALAYLPIAFPFAIATVVGGIDCTESAAAAGDKYDTRTVIAVEALATLIAGILGRSDPDDTLHRTPRLQSDGWACGLHARRLPCWWARPGWLVISLWLNAYIPAPAVYPILVFIGLEITAQSFLATPRRHYTAVALACLPALAFLAMNLPGRIFGDRRADQRQDRSRIAARRSAGREHEDDRNARQRLYLDQLAVGVVVGDGDRSTSGRVIQR